MKVKYTEPNICELICWYNKGKGMQLCQDGPHLKMGFSVAAKEQDNIGWDNMIQGYIAHQWKISNKTI